MFPFDEKDKWRCWNTLMSPDSSATGLGSAMLTIFLMVFSLLTDQNVWPANFYDCGGTSQSPININTRTVIFDPSLPKIKLEGYDLPCKQSLKLKNNGHTCRFVQYDKLSSGLKSLPSVFISLIISTYLIIFPVLYLFITTLFSQCVLFACNHKVTSWALTK